MKRRSRILQSDSAPFLLAAGAYSLAWILVMPKWYSYYINVDGVCYISIAQKYLRGEVWDAINGYWGPLYSWLLMPFLLVGIEPLLAARLLGWILGLCAFGGLSLLARHYALSREARLVVALAALPVVLFFSLFGVMPDLLLTVLLLFHLYFVFHLDRSRVMYGLLAGATAAAAYLAKSYALPFFLCHLLLMTACQFFCSARDSAKRVVPRNAFCALLVFGLISSVWIGLLSAKYDKLTWSTSGAFNIAQLAPGAGRNHGGLTAPPNETAISTWEDVSYVELPSWSPYQSFSDFAYYGWKVMQNAKEAVMVLLDFSCMSGAILLFMVLLVLDRDVRRSAPDKIFYPLITLAVFCSGYVLVVIESRYLWFCCFLLLLMGGYGYDQMLATTSFFTRTRKACLIAAFVLSFALMPAFNLVYFRHGGRQVHEWAQALRAYILPGARVASDGEWQNSMCVAYHLNARYYGIRKSDSESAAIKADLDRHGIEHYLVWDKTKSDAVHLIGYERTQLPHGGMPVLYNKKGTAASPVPRGQVTGEVIFGVEQQPSDRHFTGRDDAARTP